MATLAELQAWRDALAWGRYGPEASIERDGKKVTYRSDRELRRALADLDAEIAALQGSQGPRIVYVTSDKGV